MPYESKRSKLVRLTNRIKAVSKQIDNIVESGGIVSLGDPLSIEFGRLRSQIRILKVQLKLL